MKLIYICSCLDTPVQLFEIVLTNECRTYSDESQGPANSYLYKSQFLVCIFKDQHLVKSLQDLWINVSFMEAIYFCNLRKLRDMCSVVLILELHQPGMDLLSICYWLWIPVQFFELLLE